MDTIKYRAPGKCPVCGQELSITRLSCQGCHSTLEGEFNSCKFCQLQPEQTEFIEVFLRCRGNIKEVEKELGISYPTVRARLDNAIAALGYNPDKSPREQQPDNRSDLLRAIEQGELSAQEALQQLKKTGR